MLQREESVGSKGILIMGWFHVGGYRLCTSVQEAIQTNFRRRVAAGPPSEALVSAINLKRLRAISLR